MTNPKPILWTNTLFLGGTLLLTLTAVPAYIMFVGLDAFQIALFLFFFISTGLSITLGYHRLFSHLTFKASPPVKLFTLLFGAAAFEGSALAWCADHRRHHKHVDEEEDPYCISRGFFHAHIGWLLFRHGPDTPLTWVRDLQKDRLAAWQHKNYVAIAILVSFALPTLIGWAWGGPMAALGAFLLAGVARIVLVHHMTFCINSLCHWIGSRPYSGVCSARDSFLMAVFTFGEGYHNYHHEFQYDYRNGVKPWQFDPTKWTIWTLHKLGLVQGLRTVPEEKILHAQIQEQERKLHAQLASSQSSLPESIQDLLANSKAGLHSAFTEWENRMNIWRTAAETGAASSRRQLKQYQKEARLAYERFQVAFREWLDAIQKATSQAQTC